MLQRVLRGLGWRLAARSEGSGLTARLSEIARGAETLEEYERLRDEELGPLLEGLENSENRDT